MIGVIEQVGFTALSLQANGTYLLGPIGSTLGVELEYLETPVIAGQFGTWTPIGAEPLPTSSGYEVVWKAAGADQYTVWITDSGGNFFSEPLGLVSGTDPSLEALEPHFQQDLNGDGVIGFNLPQTVIEAAFR